MRPVQFRVWLQFAEEVRTYSLSYRLLEALGGKHPFKEPSAERGLNLRLMGGDRLSIVWNSRLCDIRIEDVSNQEHCIERIMWLLEKVHEVAPMDKLVARQFITYWILPAPNDDFATLERKYRQTMIAQNDISSTAFDTSTIFDIRLDKWTLHHQSGAMATQQLQEQYLRFELDDIPSVFLFLEASILDGNVVQYSRKEMHSFMTTMLSHCVSHSESVHQVWERCL